MTRAEILAYFSSLPNSSLERVYDYGRVLRMAFPEDDLLLNTTMSQMLTKAVEIANKEFPEWDTTNSDFGRYLLELVALFSEKDFWYVNAFGQEGNLRTMGEYGNAYMRALEIGVLPDTNTLAKSEFDIEFLPRPALSISPNRPFTTYLPGDLRIRKDRSPFVFVNSSTLIIPDSASSVVLPVTLVCGDFRRDTFVFDGNRVFINRSNIDISTLSVIVNDVQFKQVPQLGNSDVNDAHFWAVPENNSAVSIYFGDGVNGRKPATGSSVEVTYVTGFGIRSNNILEGFDFIVASDLSTRRVSSAIPLSPEATGGKAPLSLSRIKNITPSVSKGRGVVINKQDLVEYLLNKETIVAATAIYRNSSITFYALDTELVDIFGTTYATELTQEIIDVMVTIGFTVTCQQTVEVPIPDMDVDVKVALGTNITRVQSQVSQAIKDFFDPRVLGRYGRSFSRDSLYLHIIQKVPDIVSLSLLESGTTNTYISSIAIAENRIFEVPETVTGAAVIQNVFINVSVL